MAVTIKLADGDVYTIETAKSAHTVANEIAAHQLFFEVETETGIVLINPRQVVTVYDSGG
jgi:hypothetical protein